MFSRIRGTLCTGVAALGVSSLMLSGLASPASALDLPSNVTLEQWADVAVRWTTGSLGINGGGASSYAEGETVPFHLDVTSAGPGTFSFSVCRDFMDGGIYGYLRLAPYDTSFNGVLSLLDGSITDAADGDSQPFTGAAVAGSVHIDSVNEVGGKGSCGNNQRETQVQITVTGNPVGAYVLWGGRLASPADPGVGGNHGAGQYPGASLSMRLGGSAKNVGIKTDAIIQLSTVTVQKVVDSGSATADQFCFNISPNPNGITLPQCPAAGQDTVAFLGLPTGNYTVTEAGLSGYSFVSGTGSAANCGFVGSAATASVTNANDPINSSCVFHNKRVFSTLTINQVIDPGDDPGRFNLQIDGSTAAASVGDGGTTGAVGVSTGNHAVGNTAVNGTDLSNYDQSINCTANGVPVALDGGQVAVGAAQDVVCTITLTPKPIVVVDPLPDPDPTPDPVVDPTPDPVVDPTPDPVVDPTADSVVDPSTDPGDGPERCATSRGKGDGCDTEDPIVLPEVEVPTTTTTTAGPVADPETTVAGGGEQAVVPAPVDQVLSSDVERAAPAPAATLPRTGSPIRRQAGLAFGLIGAGLVIIGLAGKRRPVAQPSK